MAFADLQKMIKSTQGAPRDAPRLLLIDDDELVLSSLETVLRDKYTVHTCADPEEGVALALRIRPHAIVLDIKMPKHDGFWVFEQIRAHDSKVPIIFNSAYQELLDPEEARVSYRPFAILSKAGPLSTFFDTIARAVAQSAAETRPPSAF